MITLVEAVPLIQAQYPLVKANDLRRLIYADAVQYEQHRIKLANGRYQGGAPHYFVDLDEVLLYWQMHYAELAAKRSARRQRVVSDGAPKALSSADRQHSVELGDAHNGRAAELARQQRERRNAEVVERVRSNPYLRHIASLP